MGDVTALLEELDRLLSQESVVQQQLLDGQNTEKHLLVLWSLEPLLDHLQAKEQQIRHLTLLEQKRQSVLACLAPLLHLPDADMTLEQLSARVDEPYASILLQHRAHLQQLVHALQQCNSENAMLLQDALALIGRTLAFFEGFTQVNPTYRQSGKILPPTHGRLLASRV